MLMVVRPLEGKEGPGRKGRFEKAERRTRKSEERVCVGFQGLLVACVSST